MNTEAFIKNLTAVHQFLKNLKSQVVDDHF